MVMLVSLWMVVLLLQSSSAYYQQRASILSLLRSTKRNINVQQYTRNLDNGFSISAATKFVASREKKAIPRRQPNSAKKPITTKNDHLNGVVRIYCTHSEPNYAMPWQRQRQEFSTSSGFAIAHRRILTNAHAVEHGTIIQVKKRQSEKKFLAKVVAIGHQCDLAVLEVDDDSFWSDMPTLEFGQLPNLLDEVAVIGYPVGGESMSITSGVVSRIEMQEYAQASEELLAIQIDAAINPGNSGGPVFNADKLVVGVAFQSLSSDDTENIGYVVPVNVITHFIQSLEKMPDQQVLQYRVCSLGVKIQSLESDALRRHYKLANQDTGVLIAQVSQQSPAAATVRAGDIIMSIDGIQVANDGSIPFPGSVSVGQERVHMTYYTTQKFEGDFVQLKILRNGVKLEVPLQLWVPQMLIPRSLLDTRKAQTNSDSNSILSAPPSYVMIGGLVFLKLTKEYLQAEFNLKHMQDFHSWVNRFKLLAKLRDVREGSEEVVVLSQILGHKCNVGYSGFEHFQLSKLNEVKITNMQQLKDQIWTCLDSESDTIKDELVFEFDNGAKIILDTKEVLQAQVTLCKEHMIACPYSEDLT